MDMRDFVRADAFDLVLSMFTSFGYFDDKNEDLQVLRHISNSLRSGGVCLIEVMGKECLARIYQPTTSVLLKVNITGSSPNKYSNRQWKSDVGIRGEGIMTSPYYPNAE